MRYNTYWRFLLFICFIGCCTSANASSVNNTIKISNQGLRNRIKNVNTNKYLPSANKLSRAASDRYYGSSGSTSSSSSSSSSSGSSTKYVSCSSGYYLPGSSATCKKCDIRYYCPGDTFTLSTQDQGIRKAQVTCDLSTYLPANMRSCSPCKDRHYCPGGTFFVSSTDQGITGPSSVYCAAGQYLPQSQTTCSICKKDKQYACHGGTYKTGKSYDQGIVLCPENSTLSEKTHKCSFSHHAMQYGNASTTSPISQQCWAKRSIEEYAKCIWGQE